MADKQTPLNGAFYGPSIPPHRDYHRHGRGRGCGCCGCLLGTLLKFIGALIVIIGIAVLVFWLVVRPHKVKFNVSDATLSEFSYTNNSLSYNLNMNVTVRNPNKRIGIYFDKIEARPLYKGQRFDSKLLDTFYLGHKKTDFLNPSFQGDRAVVLSSDGVTEYNNEKSSGYYTINLKLYLRIRMKIGAVKVGHFKRRVSCNLLLPVNGTADSSIVTGIGKSCSVRYYS